MQDAGETTVIERLLVKRGRPLRALLAASVLLAGCEGSVSVDLVSEPPVRRDIRQVLANVVGVEFRKDDGTTERLEFSNSTPFDLLTAVDTSPLRLFTDEKLPDGSYTGMRLLFDTDHDGRIVNLSGGQFPLTYPTGDFANVNFTIDKNKSTKESLVLVIDLRQSLIFYSATADYALSQVLRSVRTEDGGDISGTVDVTCPPATSLATGGAVYLFQGKDVTPVDIGGTSVRPYATTAVTSTVATTRIAATASYTLRFIPKGDYTVAATCRALDDDPTKKDDLAFRGTDTVKLDQAQSLTLDLKN